MKFLPSMGRVSVISISPAFTADTGVTSRYGSTILKADTFRVLSENTVKLSANEVFESGAALGDAVRDNLTEADGSALGSCVG